MACIDLPFMIMKPVQQHPEILSQYVKRIWSFTCREYSDAMHELKFFADGCPGIMFQQGDHAMMVNPDKKLAPVFLYGQTVRPIVLSASGNYQAVVATLQPDALEQVFGIPASHLTDTCVDVNLLTAGKNFSITERMLNAESTAGRVTLLEEFLASLIARKREQSKPYIKHALQVIHKTTGRARVADIACELRISQRTLGRQFEQRIGVSPKVYSSIYRFQLAVQRLEQGRFDSLAGLAYDLGYADQSHFNRCFKTYTGETPLDFLRERQGLEREANT